MLFDVEMKYETFLVNNVSIIEWTKSVTVIQLLFADTFIVCSYQKKN